MLGPPHKVFWSGQMFVALIFLQSGGRKKYFLRNLTVP